MPRAKPKTTPSDLQVTVLALADLKPYPRNPRHITPAAVNAVAESLTAFGWQQPIVIDPKKVIVAGHTRRLSPSGPDDPSVRPPVNTTSTPHQPGKCLARDEWIARTSDDQIVSNVTACKLALTTRALDYLTANDGADFLRAARALSLHFPPIQRVADGKGPR